MRVKWIWGQITSSFHIWCAWVDVLQTSSELMQTIGLCSRNTCVSPRCRLTTLLNSPPSASRSDPASCHFCNSHWALITKPNFDIIHIHNQNNILQYQQYSNWHFPVMTIGPWSAPNRHPLTILIAHHRRLNTSSTRQWIDPMQTSRNTRLHLMRPFTYTVQGPPIYSLFLWTNLRSHFCVMKVYINFLYYLY